MSIQYNSRGKATPEITTFGFGPATAAIDGSSIPISKFRILNITAHAASSVASAITVGLVSAENAVTTILSSDSSWTNLYKIGEPSEVFEQGDEIEIKCSDSVVVKSVIVRIELL